MHKLEICGEDHIVPAVSDWGYFVEEHEAKSFAKDISKSKNIPQSTYCKMFQSLIFASILNQVSILLGSPVNAGILYDCFPSIQTIYF